MGPDPAAFLGFMVCMLVVVLGIGGLIAAVILRAACSLFNKLAGSGPPPLRRPDYDLERGREPLGRGYGTSASSW